MSENKISPMPWAIDSEGDIASAPEMGLDEYMSIASIVNAPNAAAIVSAVNNTYGKGINPEVVPELLEALKDLSERAERCRKIIQYSSPGNWGMLDTDKAKAAINKAKTI